MPGKSIKDDPSRKSQPLIEMLKGTRMASATGVAIALCCFMGGWLANQFTALTPLQLPKNSSQVLPSQPLPTPAIASQSVPSPGAVPASTPSPTATSTPNSPLAIAAPTPSFSPSSSLQAKSQRTSDSPAGSKLERQSNSNVPQIGKLRIANATEFPIRVALLTKLDLRGDASAVPGITPNAAAQMAPAKRSRPGEPPYDLPAHWDFSPQEGGLRGMVVSLPGRNLRIKSGDILVAFAQDGSRRYWGPYVVGATDLPIWNGKAAEWNLVLQN